MNEPAEEQLDPSTVIRPAQCASGGRQDDSQSPFGSGDVKGHANAPHRSSEQPRISARHAANLSPAEPATPAVDSAKQQDQEPERQDQYGQH